MNEIDLTNEQIIILAIIILLDCLTLSQKNLR